MRNIIVEMFQYAIIAALVVWNLAAPDQLPALRYGLMALTVLAFFLVDLDDDEEDEALDLRR